jgi:hypothetical protein
MNYDNENDDRVLATPENDVCSESPTNEQEIGDEELAAVSGGKLDVGPNPPRGPLSSDAHPSNPAKAP